MNIWLFFIASVFCLMGATLLALVGKRNRRQSTILNRYILEVEGKPNSVPSEANFSIFNSKKNQAAGFFGRHQGIYKFFAIGLLVASVAHYFFGYFSAIMLTVVSLMLYQIWWSYRANKNQQLIVSQIPLFIDQLIRSLATGKSIESAFRLVAKNTSAPLGGIVGRVVKATDLGASMTESLVNEAESANIKELKIMALSIKISSRFGSSPREMLESVMHMIHNQEQARRELQAITGETKISALVLISVPVLILLYTMVMNPGYFEMMTSDDTGIVLFRMAIVMQVLGTFIFWRMMKSV